MSAPEIRAAQFLLSRLTVFISGSNPLQRCLRLSFRRTAIAVCGALPPTVLLRTLGESNLARDRFFLRASSAHSVRRVLDLDAVFDGDHVGGDSRHPLLPVYAALLELMRGRATLAAMTVIVVITIIVIAPGVELARSLADEAVSLLQSVRLLLDEDGNQQWLAQPWVQHLIGWWDMATFRLVDFKIDWKNLLIQGAQSSSTFIVGQVKGIAQNVLLFTVNFIVALFTVFFFLRDRAELVSRIQW